MMFVPPALLVTGVAIGVPGLAFVVLAFVMPFMRVAFGDAKGSVPEWSDVTATFLDWLPSACAVAYIGTDVVVVMSLRDTALSPSSMVLLGLSMWAAAMFASCVAHELVHSRIGIQRIAGRVLSGLIGYPVLEYEHRAHHAKNGNVEAAEWPGVQETVWGFSVRRMAIVAVNAWDGHRGSTQPSRLFVAVGTVAAAAIAFGVFGGVAGLVLYGCVSVALFWTQQAVTYIQHWGLGEESSDGASEGSYSWEDLCLLQAWLTLSVSYHQAHHAATAVPYYRSQPAEGSPRAPAGYIFLFFACLVPPIWRAMMEPALASWKRAPGSQRTAGRKLICFSP